MRKGTLIAAGMLAAAPAILLAPAALGQTWNAQTLLMKDRSPSGCSDRVSTVGFAVEGGILKVNFPGQEFKLRIGADGAVKEDVRLPNGSRGSLAGRVATREFVYTSYSTGCQYNWAQVK
jgi:hypothetical protein